ncbi:uncharacterized protein LOC141633075 isoform X3 [Silene latifolia]|uniref:uncharacterized protein LOC141633075 isoform X3 n=1 Tax=Silene latifolia TaxID=37657 RepID=UPI003D777517
MNPEKKDQLYSKIMAKYNLPEKVDGQPVIDSLSFQCSTLYRQWRYRLKENHFRGKKLAQAKDSRPLTLDKDEWDWLVFEYWGSDKQKKRSKTNTDNKMKQLDVPANGSRSTARIFYDMINEPSSIPTQDLEGESESLDTQQEPLYIRLFEKTKKHKSTDENNPWGPSGFGPNHEKHFEELKRLHEAEIEKCGEDTLNVKDAYMKVLNHKSGYVEHDRQRKVEAKESLMK